MKLPESSDLADQWAATVSVARACWATPVLSKDTDIIVPNRPATRHLPLALLLGHDSRRGLLQSAGGATCIRQLAPTSDPAFRSRRNGARWQSSSAETVAQIEAAAEFDEGDILLWVRDDALGAPPLPLAIRDGATYHVITTAGLHAMRGGNDPPVRNDTATTERP